MNVEVFESPENHPLFQEIVNAPVKNAYEPDTKGQSPEEFVRNEYDVDIADSKAMLALFRELSSKGETVKLGRLHNLYRDWKGE